MDWLFNITVNSLFKNSVFLDLAHTALWAGIIMSGTLPLILFILFKIDKEFFKVANNFPKYIYYCSLALIVVAFLMVAVILLASSSSMWQVSNDVYS